MPIFSSHLLFSWNQVGMLLTDPLWMQADWMWRISSFVIVGELGKDGRGWELWVWAKLRGSRDRFVCPGQLKSLQPPSFWFLFSPTPSHLDQKPSILPQWWWITSTCIGWIWLNAREYGSKTKNLGVLGHCFISLDCAALNLWVSSNFVYMHTKESGSCLCTPSHSLVLRSSG